MSKLSPGPWRYVPYDGDDKDYENEGYVADGNGHNVTSGGCGCCTPAACSVSAEDGKVIAKVPEYRELLLTLKGQFQEWIEANRGMDLNNPGCLDLREYWRDRIGALLKDIP